MRPDFTARHIALILLLLAIAGCATQRGADLPELSDWDSRTRTLAEIANWEFRGRIGVSAGNEGFNGKLRYAQINEAFRATVSGPLGFGTVRIDGDRKGVTITDKDGEETVLRDPEFDLRARYGWTIPVTSLRFWALGIPDPSAPAVTEFGEDGLLTSLEQGSWLISITQYRDGGGQSMPRRLTAISGDSKVRLLIDDWTFH